MRETIISNRGRHKYRLASRLIEEVYPSARNLWAPRHSLRLALLLVTGGSPAKLEVFDGRAVLASHFNVYFVDGRVHIGCRVFSRKDSARLLKWAGVELG